jgi:hypothetical protein
LGRSETQREQNEHRRGATCHYLTARRESTAH